MGCGCDSSSSWPAHSPPPPSSPVCTVADVGSIVTEYQNTVDNVNALHAFGLRKKACIFHILGSTAPKTLDQPMTLPVGNTWIGLTNAEALAQILITTQGKMGKPTPKAVSEATTASAMFEAMAAAKDQNNHQFYGFTPQQTDTLSSLGTSLNGSGGAHCGHKKRNKAACSSAFNAINIVGMVVVGLLILVMLVKLGMVAARPANN